MKIRITKVFEVDMIKETHRLKRILKGDALGRQGILLKKLSEGDLVGAKVVLDNLPTTSSGEWSEKNYVNPLVYDTLMHGVGVVDVVTEVME